MKREPLAAPPGLSQQANAIWREETASRTRSPGRLALLEQCLRALDRSAALRARLEVEGDVFVTKTTGVSHPSPLVKLELAERSTFMKLATALSLNWNNYGGDGGTW
jgi:hypothetical protein